MRTFLPIPILLLAAATLVACDRDDHQVSVAQFISIHGDQIAVHAPGHADADINAAGDLRIADQNIATTTAERDLLKRYFTTAMALRDHGIATGKAGAAVAGQAIGSVVSGLASGNTDKIDSEVNASAAKVEAKVALICDDLGEIQSTQQALASQLEAFRPYALIKADEAERCRGGLKNHQRS